MKRLIFVLSGCFMILCMASVAHAQRGALVKGTFKMVEGTVGKGWSSGISVAGTQRYLERQIIWSGMNQAVYGRVLFGPVRQKMMRPLSLFPVRCLNTERIPTA